MAVPRSRPGDASPLKAAIDGTKRDLEQLRRQFARIPVVKPPDAAAAKGSEGFTRCKALTPSYYSKNWSFKGWQIDSTWSNFGWDDENVPPAIVAVGEDSPYRTATLAPTRDGWYWQRVRVQTDADCPRLAVEVNSYVASGGIDLGSYYQTSIHSRFGSTDYDIITWAGPFWMPAQKPGYGPFSLDVNHEPGLTVSHSYMYGSMDIIAIGI